MKWEKVKLGELINNFSLRGEVLENHTTFTFYGVSNTEGIIPTINAARDKAATYKIIEKGCFAYNPYRINVGSIAYFNNDDLGLISPAYVVFKVKENRIYDKLLLDFLKSEEGLFQIKLHARGTVRQALRFEDLCQIELYLPSYNEQKKLYQDLNKIEQLTYRLRAEQAIQLKNISSLRQQILKDAIQGKLVSQEANDETASELLKKIEAEKARLIKEKKIKKEKLYPPIQADEIPFEIPDSWKWCRLGVICYIASGSTPKKNAFVDDGIPYLKMYNIRNQKIDFDHKPQYITREIHEGLLKRSRTEVGDVIMNIVGPPLGKVAIIPPTLPEVNFNQAGVLIRPLLFKKYNLNFWIYWYLNEMSEINSISTKGVAGQDNISVTQVRNMKLALPPLAEQQRIVERVDELMELCDKLEKAVTTNQKLAEKLYQSTLREALQPKKAKKIALNPIYCDVPKRSMLAGYILNQCHSEDSGRVKFMKLLYLVEHMCYLDFNSQYVKKPAGPYDDKLIGEIEAKLGQLGYYETKQNKKNKHVSYIRSGKADELNMLFANNFSNEKEKIDNILVTFKKFDTSTCEIIATLYAAWNNRIIQNETIEDSLLKQDFLDWDEGKKKHKDRLDKALDWMRNNNVIPSGYGKYIDRPQKD